MKYLLDTNQVVYYLRQEGLAVSIISVAELYEGIFRATNPEEAERALKDFLSEVTVLSIDEEVARIFGQERARLRQVGLPMSDLDLLIAATALRHDLTLLTADRDFERVEHLNTIFP